MNSLLGLVQKHASLLYSISREVFKKSLVSHLSIILVTIALIFEQRLSASKVGTPEISLASLDNYSRIPLLFFSGIQ